MLRSIIEMEKNHHESRIRLLILTTAYPYKSDYQGTFIREQTEQLLNRLDRAIIISPLAYYPKLALRWKWFRRLSLRTEYPEDSTVGNLSINFPRFFTFPQFGFSSAQIRADFFHRSIVRTIEKKNFNFDLIHAHFIFPSGLSAIRLKKVYGLPIIITAHGGDVYRLPFLTVSWKRKCINILECADQIITTSTRNARVIKETLGIDKEKVSVIPNGFKENLFAPTDKNLARRIVELPIQAKVILSIGNLTEIKGHRFLLEAMKRVLEFDSEIICVIIGRGRDENILKNISKNLGIEKSIRFIPGIPHEDIPIWLNASDIFVLPSLDEGFPTVIPEALGCGLPVVATRVGAIPESIDNRNISILVEPGDSEMLADGIKVALDNQWRIDEIRKFAVDNYSWGIISRRIIGIYSRMVTISDY